MKQDVKGEHHKALVLVQCGVQSLCPGVVWCREGCLQKWPKVQAKVFKKLKIKLDLLRRYGSVLERVVIIY